MNNVFTMQGRLSRKQYFLYSTAITAVTYVCVFMVVISSSASGQSVEASGGLGFLIGMLSIVAQLFLAVRRFHDLGKPGWHVLLLAIPFYNFYLALVLVFTRGVDDSNEHGPNPVTA
jgi:uncharacterized membrane protein YhaH (DUF805 family)